MAIVRVEIWIVTLWPPENPRLEAMVPYGIDSFPTTPPPERLTPAKATPMTTQRAPRQRHQRVDTDPEEVDEPVDEDLQHKIVADIAERIASQQSRIQRLLRFVCITSAVAASGVIVMANLQHKTASMRDTITACLLAGCMAVVLSLTPDWIPTKNSTTREETTTTTFPPSSLPFAVTYYPFLTLLSWFVASVLLLQHRQRYELAVAAAVALHLVCVAAALYVRSDNAASEQLLRQVAAAKYRYKSL